MADLSILVSSGGRRPYLVRWFTEALFRNGLNGRVLVADVDPYAPAGAVAAEFVPAPPVTDPGYPEWLRRTLVEHRISLAVSINDFELSRWAQLDSGGAYAALVRLSADRQQAIEDKVATTQLLAGVGVRVPPTLLARDALRLTPGQLADHLGSEQVVVKGRFGSGSRGLGFATTATVAAVVERARSQVTHRDGRPGDAAEVDDLIVVQRRIIGQEYGVDVIDDLSGRFAAVLARRKLAMRAGETDRAETADPAPFVAVGEQVSRALGHRGLIDLDVLREDTGENWVIDVNPRFGGGYPLSHVGGAHVPAAYVAWASGQTPQPEWLRSRPGVVAAKHVEVIAVRSGA
ncbi:ATP-grasp domain-containing protein [Granulicoccus phenolivorans]|uniref:ATP-grasp domain-containing protein n=1 Tax=Granulicoccus phenolivorans TaxID=266854 RepID=UPI000403A886|nr:ATP-grasp domain-containing protein [Granulicoccus phenolivorans]